MAGCKVDQGELIEEYVNRLCPSNRTISLKSILSTRSGEGPVKERVRSRAVKKSKSRTPSSCDSESSDTSFRSIPYEGKSDYTTCDESSGASDKEHAGDGSLDGAKKNIAAGAAELTRKTAALIPSQHPKGSALSALTRQFVAYFVNPHFERECIRGIYICTVCQAACATLQKLCSLLQSEAGGRHTVLYNTTFMGVLLKLCTLDCVQPPRICTVNAKELKQFYSANAERSLEGTVRLVEDQDESKKYWEQFLGYAVKDMKTSTYMVTTYKKRHKGLTGESSCVWPDIHLNTSNDKLLAEEKRNAKSTRMPVCKSGELIVVDCMDARHLWVYCGKKAKEDAQSLSCTLYHCLPLSGEREFAPLVGDLVAFLFKNEQALRGLVLAVADGVADIWALDIGQLVKVPSKLLADLPLSFKCLPPLVSLCIVKNVRGAPYLNLLRECLKVLRNITSHHSTEKAFHAVLSKKLAQLNGFEVLSNLLSCPDYDTRYYTVLCLLQLTRRQPGRLNASKAGCATKTLEQLSRLLKRCSSGADHKVVIREKRYLVNLLHSLFFRNEELQMNLADSNVLEVLCKVQKLSSPNTSLYMDVDYCLRAFLGPLYLECRPTIQSKLAAMTPAKLKMQNLQFGCKNLPQPITREDGPKKCVPRPAHAEVAFLRSSGIRYYVRGSLADFCSDQTHELRPVHNMKQASARTLSKIMCSFMNTWRPCTIYYGITRERFVRGVILTQEERDALRRGIDFMAGNIRPHLTTCSFSVEFVPVVASTAEAPSSTSRKSFVVEISVLGILNTVYTMSEGACFLRSGSSTYQATTNEVRQWIARREEGRWMANEEEALAAAGL